MYLIYSECTPLPGCGTTITRERRTLWKIACCEPCAECRPDPRVCELPQVRALPHVFKYDCCGRCDRRKTKDDEAK
ncbi:hypothetical protein niasHT_036477 [Heterodera trifolii]|uniref:Uncharacterized protein n=1 Tax=Heterodera trifolii TaxID=157864 RepID=A0ABD2J2D9_9BILA